VPGDPEGPSFIEESSDPEGSGGREGANEPNEPERPLPPNNGGTLIPYDDDENSYIVLGDDGTPLGRWVWDDDSDDWVYIPGAPDIPSRNLPSTGNNEISLTLFFILWLALVVIGICVVGRITMAIRRETR
jgi:hypothetical protein